jgi:hypothetical protein
MIDFTGDTWKAVKARTEERLATLRTRLESEGLGIDETNSLRGAIKELKLQLDLAKPEPKIPSGGDSYT